LGGSTNWGAAIAAGNGVMTVSNFENARLVHRPSRSTLSTGLVGWFAVLAVFAVAIGAVLGFTL
jgi:hypothetical protein